MQAMQNEKGTKVIMKNIDSAIAATECLVHSLGPRGLDKMILTSKKKTVITNDGATIMRHLKDMNPVWKILQTLSESQDKCCGDGTTSVVILCGELLSAAKELIKNGMHPSRICDALLAAQRICTGVIEEMKIDIGKNKQMLIENAGTSLNSKVISYLSEKMAELSVSAIEHIAKDGKIDMSKLKMVKKTGGTVQDTVLYNSCLLSKPLRFPSQSRRKTLLGGKKLRVCLAQFCVSSPKLDVDFSVVIDNPEAMDRMIREEVQHVALLCKKIKAVGCDMLIFQKSIMRDPVSDIGLTILTENDICVVTDVDREEFDTVCSAFAVEPVSDIANLSLKKLALLDVSEIEVGSEELVCLSHPESNVCSLLIRGSNDLIVDEVQRSLNDSLQVVRSLVMSGSVLPGGGAVEIELSLTLERLAHRNACFSEFARAIQGIPLHLLKSAGLDAPTMLANMVAEHARGNRYIGINLKKETTCDTLEGKIVHPCRVYYYMVKHAFECAANILKIDDVFEIN